MSLRPDIVLQRSINAAIAGASNVDDDTDLNIPLNSTITGEAVTAALVAVQNAIGSGFRFIGKKNGTTFARLRFDSTLTIVDYTLTLPTTFTAETLLDTVLDGVLTGRIESSNGTRFIDGTLGKSAADFIFLEDIVAADGVEIGNVVMRFALTVGVAPTTTALVPVIPGGYANSDLEYKRLYGPGTRVIDALGNIIVGNVGSTEQRVYRRFRAPASGNLTAVRPYWTVGGSGYAAGTGGTIAIAIYPDDGTATHKPNLSASTFSTGSYATPLTAGAFSGGHAFNDSVTMTATAPLIEGQLYHIEYKNTDGVPGTNYISVNSAVTVAQNGNGARWLSPIDDGILFAHRVFGSGSLFTFVDFTVNPNPSPTPASLYYRGIDQLTIGGTAYANHDIEAGNYDSKIWTVTAAAPVLEALTPAANVRISGFSFMASASTAGSLTWAIGQGATILATGTVTQSTINFASQTNVSISQGLHTWYDVELSAVLSLTAGIAYYLLFTPVSPAVWKFADEFPGTFAYSANWAESKAQAYVSGSFIDADHNNHAAASSQRSNWRVVFHKAPAAAPTGGGGTVNSLDTVVNDALLANSFVLKGYESQTVGWYVAGEQQLGAIANLSNAPSWWKSTYPSEWPRALYAILPWLVIFDGVSNAATNTRVRIKDYRCFFMLNDNSWVTISSASGVNGYNTPKSSLFRGSETANSVTYSDGSVGIKPPSNTNLAWHGWSNAGRTAIDPSNIKAAFLTLQARLEIDNVNLTDDRASAQLGIQVGGDYYIDVNTNWTHAQPGLGTSRTKQVTNSFQSFNFCTLNDVGVQSPGAGITEAFFRAHPPPLD